MWHKMLFKAGYRLKWPNILRYYDDFVARERLPFDVLKARQEEQLCKLIANVYENVPYYSQLFHSLKLKPSDITKIEHLERLPILTKEVIKANFPDFLPKNIRSIRYIDDATGGSTGMPFKYRLEYGDYERSVALMYRGWGYGGYELADRVALLAGSSLIPTRMSRFLSRIQAYCLNKRFFSSFDMSQENLFRYFNYIRRWQPSFIFGYASSIYLFAQFIRENNLTIALPLKGIITTSEKLFDKARQVIEDVFGARVFDMYGLNDGGISAYECERHCGMHIDMERSILECVNDQGRQIVGSTGRLLATSLHNNAFPFIRYETCDTGIVSTAKCACGREMPLLTEISGRVTDFLKLNDITIGSPVLTVLMSKCDIVQYQIVQEDANSINCRIVKEPSYTQAQEQLIRDSFFAHVGKINIKFEYVDSIPATQANKYKFIINNMA